MSEQTASERDKPDDDDDRGGGEGEGRGGDGKGEGEGRDDSGAERPSVFDPDYLLRLLADCISYKSSLHDIGVILRCGNVVNGSVKRGLRPLHYAAYSDYAECVRFLLENGAQVNQPDDIGYTPIHLCARKGSLESMKILIEHGAWVDFFTDDNNIDENMKTLGYHTIEPLNLAIENNHIECMRLLLEKGARPDHKYFMGYEINLVPLENIECLELLLQFGADPNVCNRCGVAPLMKACRQHNLEAVRLLCKYGADINLTCSPRFEQKTALHFAVQKGNLAITSYLLRHGAQPGRPANYKYAALHTAVTADRPDICDILIKWDAEVDEVTDENTTPLMLACATPHLKQQREIVEVLLKHGANPNAHSDVLTYTSPCLAPLTEYLRCIADSVTIEVPRLLIKYGANVSFKGSSSVTRLKDPFGILHYLPNSRVENREEIFHLLIEAGSVFDLSAIRLSTGLTIYQRTLLMEVGARPLPARQLLRLFLRKHLAGNLPEKVALLPVPDIIKKYILFDA
ncbi:ankyrin repeat and SOCS box protein 8-like isoform X2 [Haliotis rubra]|uniref:ankyrin repeat and SOCS box protein 8-like isoform X2 n=1 Tax=Haliotis rubra TaxID=36100 RepID=UPI001EE57F61|nr:ankyrin repeat and SOCS box protein 8-like isoform X2 [Haliotis rubra]